MKTIKYLRNLPIRRKLTLLLLTPCVVVLLLAGAAQLGFQIRMFRNDFARDLNAVADIVGANSTATITFHDRKAAAEILNSLKAKQHIVSAILILPDGTIFATYGRHAGEPVIASEARFIFRDEDALLIKPVILENRQLATLNIVSDYRTVYASLMKLVVWMLFVVVLVGAGVAVGLSQWLQRLLSDPVLRLAQTAQTVADKKDYSVRAYEESGAELGILTRTFNQMLARIQQQDEAITLSQRKLEVLINSIESIVWERDPRTFQFSFVSRQCERILGFPAEEWTTEPGFWQAHLHPDDAKRALQACHDCSLASQPYSYEYRMRAADGRFVWIRESGSVLVENGKAVAMRGIFLDISAQKTAADELERLNRRLLETSRLAGMAEVATGVLHNVGNVLNSVGVSATVVSDRLRQSAVASLRRATGLLQEQNGHLAQFLTSHPKGKLIPEFLCMTAEQLATEHTELIAEMNSVGQHIQHIKEIVAMQQTYAKVSGAYENLSAASLVEDALRINATAFDRHRIQVVREFADATPLVCVDRHKVLQILINLLRNAKYAMDGPDCQDRRLIIGIEPASADRVKIVVHDHGMGIAPENLVKIFNHGFTTKTDGHGFGLHSGANAAKELGGSLTAHSDGPGQGATFTLELPAASNSMKPTVVSIQSGL